MPFSLCAVTVILIYSVGPHTVSNHHIYTFVVSRAFMAGAASQAGDADSSRAPGLTSGLQGSVNVHRGALLLVPQWRCISSFVFYNFVLSPDFWISNIPRYFSFAMYPRACKKRIDIGTFEFSFTRIDNNRLYYLVKRPPKSCYFQIWGYTFLT